jgi:hypothetical protein
MAGGWPDHHSREAGYGRRRGAHRRVPPRRRRQAAQASGGDCAGSGRIRRASGRCWPVPCRLQHGIRPIGPGTPQGTAVLVAGRGGRGWPRGGRRRASGGSSRARGWVRLLRPGGSGDGADNGAVSPPRKDGRPHHLRAPGSPGGASPSPPACTAAVDRLPRGPVDACDRTRPRAFVATAATVAFP